MSPLIISCAVEPHEAFDYATYIVAYVPGIDNISTSILIIY
jgi:hypothetical protein